MASTKGLSMICKFESVANTYLRKVIKFQGNGFCFELCSTQLDLSGKSPLPPVLIVSKEVSYILFST